MSVNDRRAASYMSAPRPRVRSNRNSDPEKVAALQSRVPPSQMDINMEHVRGSSVSLKNKMSRDQATTSEKRAGRSDVREKAKSRTRNSVQDTGSAVNRGNLERSRSKRASSPNVRKKEKEPVEGQSQNNPRALLSYGHWVCSQC